MSSGIGVFSEYGKLREVVVGHFEGFAYAEWSNSVRYVHPELRALLEARNGAPLDVEKVLPERYEATVQQLDDLAATYEKHGVKVHRARPFHEDEKGFAGHLQGGHALIYPADPVFVLGKHYMELCIRRPYRRKEVFPLRDLIFPMMEDDPDAHHVAVPQAAPRKEFGEGPGPFLEGGDIIAVGKDVIVGMGDVCSNAAGAAWLARYLRPFGYTVHPMPIDGLWLHALGVTCLLREGLLMAYMPALKGGLPAPVKDWEVIEITRQECEMLATVGVSLDQKRYMINHRHNRIMEELDKRGIEPIPLQTEDISFWGGDIRCSTLPLVREAA
ncbi:MAG: amidinotransferase [Pseudomonadota bacterium]